MKFMLMMNTTRADACGLATWSRSRVEAHFAYLDRAARRHAAEGTLVAVDGLVDPAEAKLVRADQRGAPVTDGVFPEAKEFLAGFWIVDVESPQRAYEIAAELSLAPGPGGVALHRDIEVRQLMSAPVQESFE